MINIEPEQLENQLHKKLYQIYILFGNENFQIYESINIIKLAIQNKGSTDYFNIQLVNTTNWNLIFSKYQTMNLWTRYQIIDLDLSNIKFFNLFEKQIKKIFNLIYKDIILIIRIIHLNQLNQLKNYINKLKILTNQIVLIPCHNLNYDQLTSWIINRSNLMKLSLDHNSIKLLCFFYENNLLELNQQLEILSLINIKETITTKLITEIGTNSQNFHVLHWIDALLEGNIKRALHVLCNLLKHNVEVIFLLRMLKNNILILLNILHGNHEIINEQKNFLKYKKRNVMFINAAKRLDINNIVQIVNLIYNIELLVKANYISLSWDYLETLSMLFCCDVSSGHTINEL